MGRAVAGLLRVCVPAEAAYLTAISAPDKVDEAEIEGFELPEFPIPERAVA